MKRINNKGFTLIELLAVVVILLAISMIAISSISAAIERNKANQNDTKKKLFVSYGELYYEEHKNSLAEYDCFSINLLDLSSEEVKNAFEEQNDFAGYIIFERDSNGKAKNFQYADSADGKTCKVN